MSKQSWKPGNMLYPVPAVMVSCQKPGEKANIVTVAWAGTICSDPAMVSISVRPERYSHDIIKESGEFVINLVSTELTRACDWCGVKSGRDVDKFKELKLNEFKSEFMDTPAIDESPVNIYCKVKKVEKLGSHDMFIAQVVGVTVDDKYMDETDKECEYEIYTTQEKSHGRIETRTCYVLNEVAFFTDYLSNWKGLKKIFAVKREVEKDGKKTKEISCYLSSRNATAKELLMYTRKHWQIESMHHILDVSYDEDRCKLLSKRAQENMNIFRKMGVSIHKNYLKDKKQTVKSNMFNCLLNDCHLMEILQFCNIL